MLRASPFGTPLVPLLLIFGLLAPSAAGQATTGNLMGTVRDARGEPLGVEATVTATNTVDGRSRTTRAKRDGMFRFNQLPAGRYSLEVAATGFETRRIGEIVVGIGRTVEVPVTLSSTRVTSGVAAPARSWLAVAPGVPVTQEMGGGPSSFRFELDAGSVAELDVEANEAVVVRVFDPSDRRLAGAERPGRDGLTRLFVLARSKGSYRVDVHAFGLGERGTRCRVTLTSVRRATARDEAAQAARARQWRAAQLEAERTTESLTTALREYEAAAESWRSAGDAEGEAYVLERMARIHEALGNTPKATELRQRRAP